MVTVGLINIDLTAQSHYLIKCWYLIPEAFWINVGEVKTNYEYFFKKMHLNMFAYIIQAPMS